MDSKMTRAVLRIRRVLRDSDHIEDASVSELSFKPDFMINMERNLIFVEITHLKKGENVDWRQTKKFNYYRS